MFLGAERTDQVKWGFHSPNCGCIHLSWVANEEDGGKFITCKESNKDQQSGNSAFYVLTSGRLEEKKIRWSFKHVCEWLNWIHFISTWKKTVSEISGSENSLCAAAFFCGCICDWGQHSAPPHGANSRQENRLSSGEIDCRLLYSNH